MAKPRRLSLVLFALAALILHPVSLVAQERPPEACCPLPPLVFVADGAGDFRGASHALLHAVSESRFPLAVQTFVWSHGHYRIVADQVDFGHFRKQGARLAELVLDQLRREPGRPVYLLGHSAGCCVVLAAAERLPPDCLERIVFLSPSVPVDYDLRPALRTARCAVDVFYSPKDGWYLRAGTFLAGVLHGRICSSAGCHGFCPPVQSAADAACYARLREFPWGPELSWTGNHGGHYGGYQLRYLQAFVLPLFVPERRPFPYAVPSP